MRRVYKYTLSPDMTSVNMPLNTVVLSTAFQGENLQLWALVDDTVDETVNHTFYVAPTGESIPPHFKDIRFIGTAFYNGGVLVFHVFEICK